jgi:hypothetical protein
VLEDSLKLGEYLTSLLTARKQMWEPDFAGDTLRIFVSGMPKYEKKFLASHSNQGQAVTI